MKKFAITTIIALSVAAPALAQSQLERSVGAAAGQYTLSELAQLKAASTESGNEGRVYLGYPKINFSASNVHNPVAQRVFDRLAEESRGDGS